MAAFEKAAMTAVPEGVVAGHLLRGAEACETGSPERNRVSTKSVFHLISVPLNQL
jgi:hypothetical protein